MKNKNSKDCSTRFHENERGSSVHEWRYLTHFDWSQKRPPQSELFLSHWSNTHLVEQFKHFWKGITHHKKSMRL